MSSIKQTFAIRTISVLALLVSLTLGASPRGSIAAQTKRDSSAVVSNQQRVKVSSDLRKQAQHAESRPQWGL